MTHCSLDFAFPTQEILSSSTEVSGFTFRILAMSWYMCGVNLPALQQCIQTWNALGALKHVGAAESRGRKPASSVGRWGLVRMDKGWWALLAPFTIYRGKQNSALGGSVGNANWSWVGAICIRAAQGLSSWIRTFKPLFGVLTEQKRCGHLCWLLKKCAWSHSHSLLP